MLFGKLQCPGQRGRGASLGSVVCPAPWEVARPVDAHAEDCVLVPGDMDDEPRASRDVVLEDASADEPLSIGQRVQGEFVMQR